jgi:hypothetical protein
LKSLLALGVFLPELEVLPSRQYKLFAQSGFVSDLSESLEFDINSIADWWVFRISLAMVYFFIIGSTVSTLLTFFLVEFTLVFRMAAFSLSSVLVVCSQFSHPKQLQSTVHLNPLAKHSQYFF